jgi:simple sugar transport system ATP-binding protein/site-specific DNA recombinase
VLELKGVTVRNERGLVAVSDLNLEVRGGEIVSLAGVQGNGHT